MEPDADGVRPSEQKTLPPIASGCPSAAQLRRLRDPAISDAERRQLNEHLLSCSECMDAAGRSGAASGSVPADPLANTTPREAGSPAITPRDVTPQEIRFRASEAALVRGDSIGRYVVLSQLGAGGMGVVYAAYDPELDRKVAIKLMLPRGGSADTIGRSRLVREAQAMAKLSDPNVIAVHDVGTFGEQVFIAMEFVDGQTLGHWLEEQTRSWRDVVDVFIAAARGLRAAHEAGLAHRDFKPDNVLVDHRGRVRVMDFGLAAPLRDALADTVNDVPAPAVDVEAAALEDTMAQPGRGALDERLTATGAVLGTPAYMAPEQHLGQPTDPRTDQFSYCVALFQGLYGTRPFAGDTVHTLARAVTRGEIREIPVADVPARVRRAVIRGLSVKPEDRFPCIADLIAQLERSRMRRRAPIIGAAVVLGAAGAAAVGATMFATMDEPCEGTADAIAQVWNPSRADGVRAAFDATGVGFARSTYHKVHDTVAGYAEHWTAMRVDNCEATRVRGEQSDTLLDLRTRCLNRQLGSLDATLSILESADAEIVSAAVGAVAGLPAVEGCADVERLQAAAPLPDDPGARAAIEAVWTQLAAVQANHNAGRLRVAVESGTQALEAAHETQYAPVIADAAIDVATAQVEALDVEGAEANLRIAIEQAAVGGTDEIAARAWIQLIALVANGKGDPARALEYDFAVNAAIQRAGGDPALKAMALDVRGLAHAVGGDLEGSEPLHREAIEIFERERGPNDLKLYSMLHNLAATRAERGDLVEAGALFRRSVELLRHNLGDGHPSIAYGMLNVAQVEFDAGNVEQARKEFETWLPRYEEAVGPEHATMAVPLGNLGDLYSRIGETTRGLVLVERAVKIRETSLGPDHPFTAKTRIKHAGALLDAKRLDEALGVVERAVTTLEALKAPEVHMQSAAHEYRGRIHAAKGDHDAALADYERAMAMLKGLDDPMATGLLVAAIAEVHYARAEIAAATDKATAGLAMLEGALGPDHPMLGDVLDLLSKLSRQRDDPAAAAEYAARRDRVSAIGQ